MRYGSLMMIVRLWTIDESRSIDGYGRISTRHDRNERLDRNGKCDDRYKTRGMTRELPTGDQREYLRSAPAG